MLHRYLQAVGVFGGVNGGMGLIRFVPISWSGSSPVENALCKCPPLMVLSLLLNQGSQVEVLWEYIGLSAGIADKSKMGRWERVVILVSNKSCSFPDILLLPLALYDKPTLEYRAFLLFSWFLLH